MPWLWAILLVLVAIVVVGQVAFIRSTAGLKGSRAAAAVRIGNLVLVFIALALAAYATWVSMRGGA